jgi:hypothetical protein
VLWLLVAANVLSRYPSLATLMMETTGSSETSVLIVVTQSHIPEYGNLLTHRREIFKAYIALTGWAL